jgi:hypothetical protein
MKKLFVVPFPIQKREIDALCWGSGCGLGIIGAIDLGVCTGVPCRVQSCPHVDREMDKAMGEVNGEPVYLRKLKAVTDAQSRAI